MLYLIYFTCTGIACSFHDVDANGEPCTVEYYGKICNIIEVKFASLKRVLLKVDWYDSKATPRGNPRVLVDECKFTRVRTNSFMPSHLVGHEPFVYPLDEDQVFFVGDRLNTNWHLVVKYEARSHKVVYDMKRNNIAFEDDENIPVQHERSNTDAPPLQFSEKEIEGDLLSIEFTDEEEDGFTNYGGREGTLEGEEDSLETAMHAEPTDHDNMDFDIHAQESVQLQSLHPRARVERYIGEILVGEDNFSDPEMEALDLSHNVIGYLGSDDE